MYVYFVKYIVQFRSVDMYKKGISELEKGITLNFEKGAKGEKEGEKEVEKVEQEGKEVKEGKEGRKKEKEELKEMIQACKLQHKVRKK